MVESYSNFHAEVSQKFLFLFYFTGRCTIPPLIENPYCLKTWGIGDVAYAHTISPNSVVESPTTGYLVIGK